MVAMMRVSENISPVNGIRKAPRSKNISVAKLVLARSLVDTLILSTNQ